MAKYKNLVYILPLTFIAGFTILVGMRSVYLTNVSEDRWKRKILADIKPGDLDKDVLIYFASKGLSSHYAENSDHIGIEIPHIGSTFGMHANLWVQINLDSNKRVHDIDIRTVYNGL